MDRGTCPHSGSTLPIVRDAFCATCGEPLDEPPRRTLTPQQQAEVRAQLHRNLVLAVLGAIAGLKLLGLLVRMLAR